MNLGVFPERRSKNVTPLFSADPQIEHVSENLAEMDLSPRENNPSQVVQASETMAISQMSHHAQMAITTPHPRTEAPAGGSNEGGGFPFPEQDLAAQKPEATQSLEDHKPAPAKRARTISQTQANGGPLVNPRVLLVDDNKINLKLLETFLKKQRKYTRIDLAEDGQQALDVFTLNSSLGDGFEIVFMDISMPVMNGFEATRAIREYEDENPVHVGKGSMVIALTGLASGKDQAEGFDAGVDIYLTKPVRFKEVGKLLDNWEAHQKLKEDTEELSGSLQARMALDQVEVLKEAISSVAEAGKSW